MTLSGNYVGRRIYIHAERGDQSTSTTILEQQHDTMTIVVAGVFEEKLNGFVTVLILANEGVHEYRGKMRRSRTNISTTEIALSSGKVKESRTSRRYDINTTAMVNGLVINSSPVVDELVINTPPMTFQNAMEVFIINLSGSGALIRTQLNSFSLDSILEFKLNIGGNITPIRSQVVWSRVVDATTSEYGCQFV